MSKFYLYRKQKSEGCGRSIDCGITLDPLNAKTKEEAIEKVLNLPADWKEVWKNEDAMKDYIYDSGLRHLDESYHALDECTIIEVLDNEIDMFPILKAKQEEINNHYKALRKVMVEEEEFKQYKRLQKKFEKDK